MLLYLNFIVSTEIKDDLVDKQYLLTDKVYY